MFGDLLANLVCWIKTAMVEAVNMLVVSLGALANALLAILPPMPALPAGGTFGDLLGVANWFFPFGSVVTALTLLAGLYLIVLLVRAGLRWVRMFA